MQPYLCHLALAVLSWSTFCKFCSLHLVDPVTTCRRSYDAFSSILGEGKPFVGIANSYLQSGHTVLLALVLLCGFVELPGFPLTSLPYDVREFLKVRAFFLLKFPFFLKDVSKVFRHPSRHKLRCTRESGLLV